MWKYDREDLNPSKVLERSVGSADMIENLVPENGIAWLYGASMTYKTFTAMSMAVKTSRGASWMGKMTTPSVVVYVGAEGGSALHLRRAAAEMAEGASGLLFVVQERPQLDTPQGAARLAGIISGIAWSLGVQSPAEIDGDVELETVFDSAQARYRVDDDLAFEMADGMLTILCVIDTYSQTASGDDKGNVSAYVKSLRGIIDASETPLSFIVVDHATKAGGSYVGSVAKLNDVDSQLELLRVGENRATLYQRKVKDGIESAPIQLEMVPYTLDEYLDAYGKPLTSLVVRDGTQAAKLAELAEGKAGILLGLLQARGGVLSDADLRDAFAAHASNEGIKADSVSKAYRRARESLLDANLIADERGLLTIV